MRACVRACVRVCVCVCAPDSDHMLIGRVNFARENEVGGCWGQEVHILHVNI